MIHANYYNENDVLTCTCIIICRKMSVWLVAQ